MAEYTLEITQDLKNIYKKYIGKTISPETSGSLTKDITDYILPTKALSIELRKNTKRKYYVCPKNLYTSLVLKGIVLPYQLVKGKDSIQIDDRVFSFVDGKCSIKTI